MPHPETGKAEIFIGNTEHVHSIPYYLKPIQSIRFGKIAFDIHGKKLPPSYKPLFIAEKEVIQHDRIMMERSPFSRYRQHGDSDR